MELKDYYGILEIEPSAGIPEIKKAYRKLAQQYHPDKKPGDPYAAALFAEIKEAYEVLTDPGKKEYYLQQRWYNQSTGKRRTQDVITPVTVLKNALELEKYVSTLDVFRLDKPGLQGYILDLVPDTVIAQLRGFNEPESLREIVYALLRAAHPLPGLYVPPVLEQLSQLAAGDLPAEKAIAAYSEKTRRRNRKEKYSLLLIIAATLLLCLLIFLAGR